jgi:RND superfamily putative drug exporter
MPQLDRALKGTGTAYEAGAAHQAEQLLKKELNVDANALTIVFQTTQPTVSAGAPIEPILTEIRRLSGISSVISASDRPAYRTADGRTQYAIVNLKSSDSEVALLLEQVQQVLTRNQTEGWRTFLTGKPVVDSEAQKISKDDLSRAELIALPLTLVALLLVFGSVVAAGMPVAMGAVTVSVTLGLLYLISFTSSVSIFALNITSMLGLGLGIDYSLLIVSRFREELATSPVEQAIVRTVDTAGRAVFFSGLTVCIGLVCLLMFPIVLLQSLGIAGSLVVVLSVAAALTLLPALMGMVGHRINWGRRQGQTTGNRDFWGAIARFVIRHSLAAIVIVLMIVAGLTSPFLSARFGLGDANILPNATPAREAVTVLNQTFGAGETTPILLAVRAPANSPILSAAHTETLYNFVQQLQKDPRVARVNSLFNLDPRLNLPAYQQLYQNPAAIPLPNVAAAVQQLSNNATTLIAVTSRAASNDADSRNLVKELRTVALKDLTVDVGGQTASELDTIQVVYDRFPVVLVAMMTVTFLVLCVLLNSIVLPLKAIAMNLLSIGASFGALVFIFQEGNFQTWLNFTAVGYLDVLLPVVLFCVLFGLSMDYEVFLLSRMKEAYDHCGNNSESVVEGLRQTGGIITSAALLMIIVTGAFALTSIIFVKALGLGIAIAVLIDTSLIRAIFVPAAMQLMGKWNWWAPKFLHLDRISVRID